MREPFSYERILRAAWDRTLKAWPVMLVQAGYVLATYAFIIVGALVALVPLFLRFQKDHPGTNLKNLQASDLDGIFTPGIVVSLCILIFLVLAWLFLIGLFVKGGTYGRLWGQAVQGAFDLRGFFSDAADNFARLLGYQFVVLLAGSVVGVVALAVIFAGVLLAQGGHEGLTLFLILLGGGLLLLVVLPLLLAIGAYVNFVLAHLTHGQDLGGSFRRGWETLKDSDWRGLKLVGGLLVAWCVLMVGAALFFEFLNLLPLVKYLSMVAQPCFNLVAGVLATVYLPVLSIAYIQETEPGSSKSE